MQGAIYSQRSAPRVLAILAWFVVVALVLSACGTQQTPKVYRIGVLSGLEFVADITNSFKAGMTELGYIEGQNVSTTCNGQMSILRPIGASCRSSWPMTLI
ncbi:MAG: hypothetical protein HXY39_09890 [Chloroflexi bacterium]|nr:hypothetical protein [Chloroflexota bacterium]